MTKSRPTRPDRDVQRLFSVAPDIPRYALSEHNTLHKIAEIARESELGLLTRVSLGHRKWPELQAKNEVGEWGPMPQDSFEMAI